MQNTAARNGDGSVPDRDVPYPDGVLVYYGPKAAHNVWAIKLPPRHEPDISKDFRDEKLENFPATERLDPRFDLRRHSPTGLSWGYPGSGPAQCAIAILSYHAGDAFARSCYQDFKFQVLTDFSNNEALVLPGPDVTEWVESRVNGDDS